MRELTLDEIKSIELDVLKQFHEICTQNGYRYSLAGGTLLGAVRHKGFIPWDDDIDVAMPRDDYNRFIDFCLENKTPFGIATSGNRTIKMLFSKIYAKNTVVKEESTDKERNIGVWIDVFPLDGLGNNYDEAVKNFSKSRFDRELLIACNWSKYTRSKTHSIVIEPVRLAFFILSRIVNPYKLISKIEKRYYHKKFDDMLYAGALLGSYRTREIMETKVLCQLVDLEFEGYMFKGFKNYEKYLSNLYGDYMKLPPKEKQISHHDFKAYLL